MGVSLKEGDLAPDFELKDSQGNVHRLSAYRGKTVVLYFYPKDDTPGCTAEACSFRDRYDQFSQHGIEVFGISPDTPESHSKFATKYGLPMILLSDIDHKVAEAYGCWGEKVMYGKKYLGVLRTTFIIDPEGRIQKIYENVKPQGHADELLKDLAIA